MHVYLLLTQSDGMDQQVRAFASSEDRYKALLAWCMDEFPNHHDLISEASIYGVGGLCNWLDDMARSTGAELPFYLVEDCTVTPPLPFPLPPLPHAPQADDFQARLRAGNACAQADAERTDVNNLMDIKPVIVGALRLLGVEATHEYPGFIAVPVNRRKQATWAFGTANPTWCGDLTTADGVCIDSTDFGVPSTTDDAELITTMIWELVR